MKKVRPLVALLVISLILFLGSIGLLVSACNIDKQTESTTTSYEATIKEIVVTDTGKNASVEIGTEEYDTAFLVTANVCRAIGEEINSLEEGQTVTFRVENIKAKQVNRVEFIDVVSLKTETKDVFTLDQYNEIMRKSAYPARIACVALAVVFLCTSLLLWLRIKRKKRNNFAS